MVASEATLSAIQAELTKNILLTNTINLLRELTLLTSSNQEENNFLEYVIQLARLAFSAPIGAEPRLLSTSTLTGDRIPIELALSLSTTGVRGYGCNVDVAATAALFADKLAIARQTAQSFLNKFAACNASTKWMALHEHLMNLLFPPFVVQNNQNRFALWIGLFRATSGVDILKIFYNIRAKQRDGDHTLKQVIQQLFPFAYNSVVDITRQVLPAYAVPVCLALEQRFGERERHIKIYYRCMETILWTQLLISVEQLGFSVLSQALERILMLISPHWNSGTERSVLVYTAISNVGLLTGINVYFVLGSFVASDAQACKLINHIADELSIDITPYRNFLQHIPKNELAYNQLAHHTILGFGHDGNSLRMNIYLKPSWDSLADLKH